MQLQRQVTKLRNRLDPGPHIIGQPGEPTIYRKEGIGNYPKYFLRPGHTYQLGDIFIIPDEQGKEYYYIVKDISDGWFKLEWPD